MSRVWLFHCDISPRVGVDPEARANVDLHKVTAALEQNPSVRDYSNSPTPYLAANSAPETPPSPDPFTKPTAFFRMFSLFKKERLHELKPGIDYRQTINCADYWKCKALFFSKRLRAGTDWRRKIIDGNYWKTESAFWESCCHARRWKTREQMTDSNYWRCEADFMRAEWKRQNHPDAESTRALIDDRQYWECENARYNDELDSGSSTPDYDIPSALPRMESHAVAVEVVSCLDTPTSQSPSLSDKALQPDDEVVELHEELDPAHASMSCAFASQMKRPITRKAGGARASSGIAVTASKRLLESEDAEVDCSSDHHQGIGHSSRKRRRIEWRVECGPHLKIDEGPDMDPLLESNSQATENLSHSCSAFRHESHENVLINSSDDNFEKPQVSRPTSPDANRRFWDCSAINHRTIPA